MLKGVTSVRDTRSICCSGCKTGPDMGSGADGSGSASQSYHNGLDQGIASPSLHFRR